MHVVLLQHCNKLARILLENVAAPWNRVKNVPKEQKNMELIQEYGLGVVHNSYVQGLRSIGQNYKASFVNIVKSKLKEDKRDILQTNLINPNEITSLTQVEALNIYIETVSRKSYLRNCLANKNLTAFPSHRFLGEAKKAC